MTRDSRQNTPGIQRLNKTPCIRPMLARRLATALAQRLPAAVGATAARNGFPLRVAPAAQRWGSTNAPATSFLDPPREQDADVQRVGQHGPVRNLDIKESTVELSDACECLSHKISCTLHPYQSAL